MKKPLLIVTGWIFLITGLIGIVLPLLPTTPFLLLAAWCFSHSSRRLHLWLNSHPWFGPPIQQWQRTHTVSRQTKTRALYFILISFTATLILTPLPSAGKVLLLVLALLLMWIVAKLPERAESDTSVKTDHATPTSASEEDL